MHYYSDFGWLFQRFFVTLASENIAVIVFFIIEHYKFNTFIAILLIYNKLFYTLISISR